MYKPPMASKSLVAARRQLAEHCLSCPRCYITLKTSLMGVRLNQATAIIAAEAFTELHMGNESDQRAES